MAAGTPSVVWFNSKVMSNHTQTKLAKILGRPKKMKIEGLGALLAGAV
jgi:hypothetical protein